MTSDVSNHALGSTYIGSRNVSVVTTPAVCAPQGCFLPGGTLAVSGDIRPVLNAINSLKQHGGFQLVGGQYECTVQGASSNAAGQSVLVYCCCCASGVVEGLNLWMFQTCAAAGCMDTGLAPTQPCVIRSRAWQAATGDLAAVLHLCGQQVDGKRSQALQHDTAVPSSNRVRDMH
jgi:hypothetical protein